MTMMLLALGWAGGGSEPATPGHLSLIDELNECVTLRFQNPAPDALGMSRFALPNSFGTHFRPLVTRDRDFQPENARETAVLAKMEAEKLQVGFYLFGRAAADETANALNYRALKGPGAITIGTPRAVWYPGLPATKVENPDALPDWNTIYPVARKAMKSFEDGGKGFETTVDSWQVAARPLLAESERCVACHNNMAIGAGKRVELNHAIGGVLYAFRRAKT
jgi:hypothetical protein